MFFRNDRSVGLIGEVVLTIKDQQAEALRAAD
jgi:hypothetical protein